MQLTSAHKKVQYNSSLFKVHNEPPHSKQWNTVSASAITIKLSFLHCFSHHCKDLGYNFEK